MSIPPSEQLGWCENVKSRATSKFRYHGIMRSGRDFNWIRMILGNAIKKAEITIDWIPKRSETKQAMGGWNTKREETFTFISPDDFPHQRPSCGYCSTCTTFISPVIIIIIVLIRWRNILQRSSVLSVFT